MPSEIKIDNSYIETMIWNKSIILKNYNYDAIIGVARGGMIPATRLAYLLNKPLYCCSIKSYTDKEQDAIELLQFPLITKSLKNVLIVDDINDTGNTFQYIDNMFKKYVSGCKYDFLSLFKKPGTLFPNADYCEESPNNTWLIFPWESTL